MLDWQALLERSGRLQMLKEVRRAMRRAIVYLMENPARFGSPLYRTKLLGGSVRFGVQSPLAFRFVHLRRERKILVFAVHPVPASPLDFSASNCELLSPDGSITVSSKGSQ
jgi:hypothetical protein